MEELEGGPFAVVEESVDEVTEADEREEVEVGPMAGVEIAEAVEVEVEVEVQEMAEAVETEVVLQCLHFGIQQQIKKTRRQK